MEHPPNHRLVQKPHHKEKLDAITENLQRLEWFGLVICDLASSNWHYAESAQAA